MSKAVLNSVLAYIPEALNSLRLDMSMGVDDWCGWRQLIQCIWGDGSRAEYKHTRGAARNAEGATWLTVASTYTYPLGTAITCDKSNYLPSLRLVPFLNLKSLMRKWTWKIVFVNSEP